MRHIILTVATPTIAVLLTGCLAAATGGVLAEQELTPNQNQAEYIRTHDLEPRIARAIERSEVVKGMTREQVVVAKGKPTVVMKEENRWGYGSLTRRTWIWFKEGTVARIQ